VHDAAPSEPAWGEANLRWSAGIINHGAYDELEDCFAALARQTLPPTAIVLYDTGEDPARVEALRLDFPQIDFQIGPNRGYAGGANLLVELLQRDPDPVDFILLLNPDVELEPDYARCLIRAMARQPDVAIAAGKLLRPDAETLDSAGIYLPRNRRPRDRGADQRDVGQFNTAEFVDAATGAAMMLREKSIEDLRIDGELFDEIFFAYHEDTDLCWRARRFGWAILYEPRSIALHRRGWQHQRRFEIPISTRRHSFKNHYLQILKNETAGGFLRNLPWLATWELLRLGFVILRDRQMFLAYRDAWRELPDAWRKRALIQSRVREGRRSRS